MTNLISISLIESDPFCGKQQVVSTNIKMEKKLLLETDDLVTAICYLNLILRVLLNDYSIELIKSNSGYIEYRLTQRQPI